MPLNGARRQPTHPMLALAGAACLPAGQPTVMRAAPACGHSPPPAQAALAPCAAGAAQAAPPATTRALQVPRMPW